MNKPIKSTFVSAVFLFVILALSIVYLVDYRIREAAYQHHQVDQVLIQKKNDVFDDFNRHVSDIELQLQRVVDEFENDGFPFNNLTWGNDRLIYDDWTIYSMNEVPTSVQLQWHNGYSYYLEDNCLHFICPIDEDDNLLGFLVVRFNVDELATYLFPERNLELNYQEGILTSAGVFLCGPTADIASWINTIELMDIEYYNFTTFVTIQNNSSFQFMDNGIIKYGYVTSFDDDLYIITTITEEAFIEGYSPTQVMLDASLIRSMIIIAIFFLFIIGYELMMIRLINKSRIQLMALSSSSSGGIVVVDFDETLPIQFGNEGFYLALGYTEKEIRDKFDMQLSRIIYEKDITFCENLITHLKTHDKGDFKIRLKTKQRGLIWVHLNCSHHLDHQDSITMVMLDITESKNLNTEIKSLISTIPGGVMRTSAENWKIIFASGSLATLLGYEEEEFKEKFTYFNECVHNYDLAYYLQAIGKQPDNLYLELRLLKKDGSIAWTIINATKMLHENNEAVYQSVVLDATYQKEVSVELKKELDRSKIVMEMIDEFICEYFVDENRLISSRRFAEIIGIDLIINNFRETISKMGIIHPDDLDSFYDIYRNLDQNQKEYRMDIRLRHQDGEYVWYMFKSASLYEDDNLYKIIVKLTDINEEKNKINSLMEISVRDSFTGVYNSGNIAKFVENYLSTKNQNLSHALLMLDIDNFKSVNDKYGHDIGDKLIKEYVNRLVQFFGSGGIIGRVGGDEFVVLIKDIQSDKVLGYVEKLKRKLWKEYQFDQLVLSFSTSFGIALYPQDGTSYSILFKKADIACYESKRHGKNTTRLFQEDMLSTSLPQDSICYESVESDDLLVNCINILEEHENVSQGIHEVLDRMAHYYYFDGVLIFQYHDETRQFGYTMGYTSNPSSLTDFEYTNQTYHIQSTLLQQLSSEALFFLNDPETIRDEFVNLYELLKKEKYHSCLMCGIQEAGMMKSVIAFTSYKTIEYPKYQEVTTLVAMSRLVISYVNRMHDKLTQSPDSLVFAEIFKEKEIQAYVIDEDTHQLVYISPWLNSEFPNAKINDYCYQALRGKTDVCEDCPLHMLGQKRSIISHRHDEATNRWLGVNASRLNWGNSSHHRMIYTYDITSTIENVTLMDALTGLPNMTKFIIEGNKRLKSPTHNMYALIYADINDFRYINEVHGYHVGNKILYEVATILENDRHRDELCSHINGDRFVLLLKYSSEAALKKRLLHLTDRFLEMTQQFIGNITIMPTCGVYTIPKNQTDITLAINSAELAHKKAKSTEKAAIVFYQESFITELSKVKSIESKMMSGLQNKEFILFMQPKYDARVNQIVGLEALTRWRYDETHLLGPGEFIPIFEKNGFISKMTYYIAEEVFKIIRYWIDHHYTIVPIAINVSYNYLISDFFCNDFIELLKIYKIPPQLIEIELTETVFKENVNIILDRMIQMKNLGFKIAIDDFGSGYSSLILLRDLPVDILKLDKGFLKNNIVGKKEMVIIENIVHMAQELGIDAVSEGVESEEQLKFLMKIGCHFIQGFYFAQPMEVEKATDMLNPKKGEI